MTIIAHTVVLSTAKYKNKKLTVSRSISAVNSSLDFTSTREGFGLTAYCDRSFLNEMTSLYNALELCIFFADHFRSIQADIKAKNKKTKIWIPCNIT